MIGHILIPNHIDDSDLDPFEFRLYAHICRVCAAQGACDETTRELAEHCKISAGKVSEAKRGLQRAGLIEIKQFKSTGGINHYIALTEV